MQNVNMLSVTYKPFMLNVIMLSVVAPVVTTAYAHRGFISVLGWDGPRFLFNLLIY